MDGHCFVLQVSLEILCMKSMCVDELYFHLDLTNDNVYNYFLNNQQTFGHQSIIFGVRELDATEYQNSCQNQSVKSPPITNQPFNFSSNYEVRTYTACCYYLDANNIWRTDGLLVSLSILVNR